MSGQYCGMSSERPPSDLAVAPPVSTALRERVIDRLSVAFAEGVIDTEDFERRVTVAHRSASAAEVQGLIRDLPPTLQESEPASEHGLVPAAQTLPRARTLSVFGSTRRSG